MVFFFTFFQKQNLSYTYFEKIHFSCQKLLMAFFDSIDYVYNNIPSHTHSIVPPRHSFDR